MAHYLSPPGRSVAKGVLLLTAEDGLIRRLVINFDRASFGIDGLGCRHGYLSPHDAAHHRPREEPRVLRGARLQFSRDMDIVRNGEFEATNYFFSLGDNENVLELTFNHDGRTYELGDGLRAHRDRRRRSRRSARALKEQGSSPSASRIAFAKAARGSASSAIRTATESS